MDPWRCHSWTWIVSKWTKFLAVGVFAFAGILAYLKWTRPHRDYAGESASVQIGSAQLAAHFAENDADAMARFGNQVLEISGVVADVSAEFVLFEPGVVCRWQAEEQDLGWSAGEVHRAKARILSYDDLLGEVSGDFAVPMD